MDDWLSICIRFFLYVDLLLLLGVPVFALSNRTSPGSRSGAGLDVRRLIAGVAFFGLLVSAASMLVLAKAMSGVSQFSELSQHVFEMILTVTDVGIAWAVRVAALAAILVLSLAIRPFTTGSQVVVALLAAIALATVAWSGHGAMDEGVRRYPHLVADILHLFAAAVWVGALALFAKLIHETRGASYERLVTLSHALNGFARTGTLVVVTLVITGAVNYWLTAGPSIAPLVSGQYGVLLLMKLCLFVVMLGLAAANRFNLTPKLERAIDGGDTAVAVAALRKSLLLEAGAALLILVLVAWLGVLSPSASS